MIRIDVKNADGVLTNSNTVSSQEDADAWIQLGRDNNWWPEDAQIIQANIDALVAAQAMLNESDRAIQVGRAVLVQIRALNKQKDLTGPQVAGLFSDPTLLFLLLSGSLTLAKNTIIGFSNPLYTADDKALLVSIIDQSGLAD